jgi:DNA repair exonuclease SbcCD ATPase subunit
MILFKSISFKNFLSFGNNYTTINFADASTTLIVGSNGAGKSTILDAITFVLFNKPFRKINKPSLVNSVNNSECVVQIEFSVGKKEYKIIRGIKPNIFEIWIDDEMLNQDSATIDQQKYLEQNILRLNFKSFTQVVILGSSTFVPFMQLPAAQRRDIIEDLLDIKIFSTMNGILKDNNKSILDQIKEYEYKLELIKQKTEVQKKLIKELTELSDKSIQQKKTKIVEFSNKIIELEKLRTSAEEILKALHQEISDLGTPELQLKKLEQYQNNFNNQLKKFNQLNEFFSNNNSCPTCGQNIDNKFKVDKIKENQSQIEEVNNALMQVDGKIDTIVNTITNKTKLLNKVTKLNTSVSETNYKITNINNTIGDIKDEIEDIETKDSSVDKEKKVLDIIVNEGIDVIEKLKVLKKNKEEYEIILYLLKDTGIKSKIIKKYLPIFNNLINKYLQEMDFFVNFMLNENFEETIKSRHRDDFSYGSFSEGEKMRIDLALLFTWREIAKIKNSVNTNLLLLDEVCDSSLDISGTDDFIRILRQFDKNINVFIISHKGDILLDKFEKTLFFEKVKNFSKVKELK